MIKVALITGASSGIGKELAKIHAARGGDLIIVARRLNKLNELKNELESKFKINVKTIEKDLTKPSASKEIFEELKKENIQIEYLINNAGFGGQGKFHERKWEEDLSMIQLNIVALTELCRLFLPEFISRNSGRILNVSSTASLMPGPLQAVYFATKAYVTSFSDALTEELKNTKVSVTSLLPGATDTEFAKSAKMESAKLFANSFSAYDVAYSGYEGMLKGQMNVVAGLSIAQRVGMHLIPFAPKKVVMKQIYKLQSLKES